MSPAGCLLWFCLAAAAAAPQRYYFSERHMGVDFDLVLYAADEPAANDAAQAAFDRIDLLDQTFSDYQADSELSRLSATAGQDRDVAVSEDMWRLLTRGQQISRATGGAFDITVGPAVALWRRTRRTKRLPTEEVRQAALAAVGYQHLRLSDAGRTVRLDRPGMALDAGGIAKGFAADEALAVLRRAGITSALVAAAGDIALGDPPPDALGWQVGVAALDPRTAQASRVLLLARCGVSTSGDAFQFVVVEGRRYSHIVDPRTALGITDRSSVTVVAPDATTSDAWATAASVLGPVAAFPLIEQHRLAALAVREVEGRPEVIATPRFAEFELRVPPLAARLSDLGGTPPEVRRRIAVTLGLIRLPALRDQARQGLKTAAPRETDPAVRTAIQQALRRLEDPPTGQDVRP